ncbi:MAG: glycoside hydrolase [Anaerolineae bacterium]|nr:glycoside hydrolase [Anaerolineae bacterium]
MARLKIAYVGGGSTRGPGTVASFIHQGENFAGSEIVLIDFNPEKMQIIKTMADKMSRDRGVDITISYTTDRRAGLTDCDAVLTSYRPGGFEARHLDESIPLKYGIVGQETQGPGGFFMALRSIHVMQGILQDMEQVCPKARVFNYTNPINIISEAVTHHSDVPIISFCEGPYYFPGTIADAAGLDPRKLDSVMVGLNHGCWTVQHLYEGQDVMPLLREGYERRLREGGTDEFHMRLLKLAITMNSLPADYFQYYYFRDEVLDYHLNKPTTRAQDILEQVPGYWQHYREQAAAEHPVLDPARSRGGINELELAIDAMDAIYNDRKEILPVNIPNRGVLPDLPDDRVVEIRGYLDRNGVVGLADGHLPPQTLPLVKALAEYQYLTAEAGWCGRRSDAIQALVSHPLVLSLEKAEKMYDEMAAAHKDYLPERLLN